MRPIAYIRTGFHEKFGVPRQSRLADTKGYIEFEREFAYPEAVRGLEEFSHIWIIWQFSETEKQGWSPTVRPPKLGGNERKGVFATRSPFRPNPIGLSCVKLERIEMSKSGPILYVIGADMVDRTPILDIKPYLPYADAVPDAVGGFTRQMPPPLEVVFSKEAEMKVSAQKKDILVQLLSQDPKPAYKDDAQRTYVMDYEDITVKFRSDKSIITVVDICRKYDKI